MYKHVLSIAVVAGLGLISFHAQADSLSNIFTQAHVDGQFRSYYFSRIYSAKNPDQNAFSTAMLLDATTGTFGGGFSLTGTFLSANSFGTQSSNPAAIDTTLMGPGNSISSMGQAFLQYRNQMATVRAGYQYLNTPWMGKSDSRVAPATYNALSMQLTPVKGLNVYAIRTFEFKSRTSRGYFSTNLYYPHTFNGDNMYGGMEGQIPASAPSFKGTWAFGANYAANGLKIRGWYYNFMQFARMSYVDGSYTMKTGSGINPFIGAQWVHETSGSNNQFVTNNVSLYGAPGSQVKNNTWGMEGGINIPGGRFQLGYDKISQEAGAVGNGAIISPYTAAYATDPLYTTSMIRGLVEMGPGHAWKAKFTYHFLNNHLRLMAAYAAYTTIQRGNSHDLYFDITYNFDGYLKGLSIRDRVERSNQSSSGVWKGVNPNNGSFTYNRVMMVYKF
ncbi:MAG TPA: outer membrane porin, OprD family [Mizugakiibacter sp.]|nr:outer membrane porin, OprD family [Mizugakiibacter sp.]